MRILSKKAIYYYIFYRNSLKQSVPVTLLIVIISNIGNWSLLNALNVLVYTFPTLGLIADIIYKMTMRKNEFYFYYNGSCSIIELYFISFIVSLLLSILFYILTIWIFI